MRKLLSLIFICATITLILGCTQETEGSTVESAVLFKSVSAMNKKEDTSKENPDFCSIFGVIDYKEEISDLNDLEELKSSIDWVDFLPDLFFVEVSYQDKTETFNFPFTISQIPYGENIRIRTFVNMKEIKEIFKCWHPIRVKITEVAKDFDSNNVSSDNNDFVTLDVQTFTIDSDLKIKELKIPEDEHSYVYSVIKSPVISKI